MMNYMKSEFYRITHTKDLYLTTGILIMLALLLNIATACFGGRYAITSFSYSMLVASPMVFAAMGSIIAYFLYEGNRKNGNLKNTVASGISRIRIFAGECAISVAASTFVMILTLAVWILSAELLLEQAGPVRFQDLLMEVPMMYLIAVASLISNIVFLEFFEKTVVGILWWSSIWFFIPKIFVYLAMRFPALAPAALWMPSNFLGLNAQNVSVDQCITIWDTVDGMARCVLSGAIGIIVFAVMGTVILRKKDL